MASKEGVVDRKAFIVAAFDARLKKRELQADCYFSNLFEELGRGEAFDCCRYGDAGRDIFRDLQLLAFK